MAQDLDEMIQREGPETIAGFIAEPVMGAGGLVIPPKNYFPKINEVLSAYDVRFISDEVICGFGRTGNWFGAQSLGMKPTTITMAKAITASYFPLGAITIEDDLYQAMVRQSEKIGVFAHGYTYTGHPVGCAAALKTIEIYKRDKIIEHVQKVAPVFAERIRRLDDHPLVGNTRSIGLLGGVELVADKKTRRLFDPKQSVGVNCVANLHRHGVINRAVGGDVIAFCPPLIVTAQEINAIFDIMEKALDETETWVHQNDLRAV